MSIKITLRKPPVGLCEKGRRANNEDAIYPTLDKRSVDEHLFLVCDGVGGAAKGDVASKLVCETVSSLFQKATLSDPSFVGSVLKIVEDGFQEYTEDNPLATGMATTLTLLHFHGNGATVAHIGDSRIYHIRNGEILYRSEDHSFVQGLIKAGIISPEEARTHPRRNVITRAIQGSLNRTTADTYILQDIKAGDYFFLCSDGILESLTDPELCALLISPITNTQKIAHIKKLCAAHCRDNYSCYLIEIARCSGSIDEDSLLPSPPHSVEFQDDNEKEEESPIFQHQEESALDSPTSIIEIGGRADAVTLITPIQSSRFKDVAAAIPVPEAETLENDSPLPQAAYNFKGLLLLLIIAVSIGLIFYYFFI